MYTVIVCPECEFPKVVKDEPETTVCGRCQKQLDFRKLKHFHSTDDSDEAKRARAAVAANLRGKSDQFKKMMESEDINPEDIGNRIEGEFLSANGLDKDDISQQASSSTTGSRSRVSIVRDGIRKSDPPEEENILNYAEANDVPRETAKTILKRLQEKGEILASNNTYRLA